MSKLDRFVPSSSEKEPAGPLSKLVTALQQRAKGMAVAAILTTCSTAKPASTSFYPETVKFPPKPGEDDGIYSEGIARTQRLDF